MKNVRTLLMGTVMLAGVGMVAYAQPGSGIRLGAQTVLTPEVDASLDYDSNANLRRRALSDGGEVLDESDDDTFFNTSISLSLRHWRDASELNSRAWYTRRSYDTYTNLDQDTYGASVRTFWTRPGANTTLKTEVSAQRAVDRTENVYDTVGDSDLTLELENVSERVKRDEIRANVTLTQQLMTDLRGSASYSFADFSYSDPIFNDRTSHQYNAELNYQATPKTQPYVKVGLGIDEDEGLDGNAEKPFYLFGVRHSPTPKLDVDVSVGQESFTRTPIGEEEMTESNLKWSAQINWAATHKTRVFLNGRNGYGSVASPGGSSREEISLSLALQHQTTRQISQRLSVAWRQDDYLTPLPARGGEFDELKETLWYQYNITYQTPRPWLSLYAIVSYEDGTSKIPGDSYTELQTSFGLRARY